jgi:cytidyltransferase-like protein
LQLDEDVAKKVLGKIYVQSLKAGVFGRNLDNLTLQGAIKPDYVTEETFRGCLQELERQGLIILEDGNPDLTAEGRKKIVVVMVGGSFDIIHPGHIETLRQAKAMGDVLAVSVARDETFRRNKGKEPMHNEKLRQDLVCSIKYVDLAVLGSEKDIFETVRFLKPDIIALGYDQSHSEKSIKERASKAGIESRVVRLKTQVPTIKTSSILASRDREDLLTRM